MATLKEEAQQYEAPRTLNIAELDKIPVDIELQNETGKNAQGEEFSYKYALIDGQKYRVAGSIIGGLKSLLEKMPNLQFVSIIKSGEGMNTRYQVIPFVEKEVIN